MNYNLNLNSNNSKNSNNAYELSFFQKFKAEFKEILFNSMHVILKEEPFPMFYIILIYIIYFLQLLHIPFHPTVKIIYISLYKTFRFTRFGIMIVWLIT